VPRTASYPFRSEAARAEFEAHYDERARAWPVPSEARFIDTPSGRTFVRASGSPSAPPLILLPGARVVRLFALRPPPWPRVLADRQWQELRMPCLFVVGANEKIYSARAAVRRLGRVAPRVKTEIIAGAGHDLTLVQPELVTKRVVAFLAEQEGAGAGS